MTTYEWGGAHFNTEEVTLGSERPGLLGDRKQQLWG